MTKQLRFIPAILAASVLALTSCDKEELNEDLSANARTSATYGSETGRYLVVLKNGATQKAAPTEKDLLDRIKEKHGLKAFMSKESFREVFNGFTTELTQEQLQALRKDEAVDFIEPEYKIQLEQTTATTTTTSTTQQIPWGIQRVGYANAGYLAATAWIIDSGIQLNHPDLNVDVARSRSFLSTTTDPNDQNGHGTVVAGIVGAKNNTIGVHGVAAGIKVVALRAMDANGSGTSTSVIAALNYVAQHGKPYDVVNLSLGGPASQALDNAVLAVANKGIYVSIAAGNSATSVLNVSPARVNHPNVYTISAMQQNGYWASFSNFGSPTVDYAAPGVNIMSTNLNSGYSSGNGTSFAAPHVAGLLILKSKFIVTDGYVLGDPDGTPDRIAHK